METHKLGEKDFEAFKSHALAAINSLLLEWSGFCIEFAFNDLPEGIMADCGVNITQRSVKIRLSKQWVDEPTDDRLRETAQHEVLHLFLQPIAGLARCRIASTDELDAGEHEVLNRLRRLLIDRGVLDNGR